MSNFNFNSGKLQCSRQQSLENYYLSIFIVKFTKSIFKKNHTINISSVNFAPFIQYTVMLPKWYPIRWKLGSGDLTGILCVSEIDLCIFLHLKAPLAHGILVHKNKSFNCFIKNFSFEISHFLTVFVFLL